MNFLNRGAYTTHQQPHKEKKIIYCDKFQKLVSRRQSIRFQSQVEQGLAELLGHSGPLESAQGSHESRGRKVSGERQQGIWRTDSS
jgi:hypothetical protein